jgi:hypothetical protein
MFVSQGCGKTSGFVVQHRPAEASGVSEKLWCFNNCLHKTTSDQVVGINVVSYCWFLKRLDRGFSTL